MLNDHCHRVSTHLQSINIIIKAYLYRFKIIEAPNCPRGNDNQTAEHILLEMRNTKGRQRTPNSRSSWSR